MDVYAMAQSPLQWSPSFAVPRNAQLDGQMAFNMPSFATRQLALPLPLQQDERRVHYHSTAQTDQRPSQRRVLCMSGVRESAAGSQLSGGVGGSRSHSGVDSENAPHKRSHQENDVGGEELVEGEEEEEEVEKEEGVEEKEEEEEEEATVYDGNASFYIGREGMSAAQNERPYLDVETLIDDDLINMSAIEIGQDEEVDEVDEVDEEEGSEQEWGRDGRSVDESGDDEKWRQNEDAFAQIVAQAQEEPVVPLVAGLVVADKRHAPYTQGFIWNVDGSLENLSRRDFLTIAKQERAPVTTVSVAGVPHPVAFLTEQLARHLRTAFPQASTANPLSDLVKVRLHDMWILFDGIDGHIIQTNE